MSTDPKPPKPMPSAAEIQAYLERSAARSKLHLPLAKGAAAVMAPPARQPSHATPPASTTARALPLKGTKKLPTRPREADAAEVAAPPAPEGVGKPEPGEAEGSTWRPYSSDDER
jgi:hypothetical protein